MRRVKRWHQKVVNGRHGFHIWSKSEPIKCNHINRIIRVKKISGKKLSQVPKKLLLRNFLHSNYILVPGNANQQKNWSFFFWLDSNSIWMSLSKCALSHTLVKIRKKLVWRIMKCSDGASEKYTKMWVILFIPQTSYLLLLLQMAKVA